MKKTRKPAKPVSADAIARLTDRGKNVSGFFKGQGRMAQPKMVQPISTGECGPHRDHVGRIGPGRSGPE
jgi:hypothetical protein